MKEVSGNPDEILGCFRRLFMDGPIILIFRDPLHITASILKNRRRRGMRIGLRELVKHTSDPLRVMSRLKRYLDEPDVFSVTYEEITQGNRMVVLKQLCRFLRIKEFDRIGQPTVFGEAAVVRTSSRQVTEVFSDTAPWWNGLPARQCLLVVMIHAAIRLLLVIRGQPFGRYVELQAAIAGSVSRRAMASGEHADTPDSC
jgi:hypothetical protein